MTPSNNLIQFVKKWEGFELKAYQDVAGVWTIGFGSITHLDGTSVKKGDVITAEQAEEMLMKELNIKAAYVRDFTSEVTLNQNQFDALCDFAYNLGTGALQQSTLLKLIHANPSDSNITNAFLMWDKITKNGKKVDNDGLFQRRKAEAHLYFTV